MTHVRSAAPVFAPAPAAAKAPHSPPRLPVAIDQAAEAFDDGDHDFERLGQQLAASGSLQQAVVAFRQWAYLSPDDPAAHSQLGSTLEAIGDTVAASRAHRAALAALDRSSPERGLEFLHGFSRTELRRMLVDRCASAARS